MSLQFKSTVVLKHVSGPTPTPGCDHFPFEINWIFSFYLGVGLGKRKGLCSSISSVAMVKNANYVKVLFVLI